MSATIEIALLPPLSRCKVQLNLASGPGKNHENCKKCPTRPDRRRAECAYFDAAFTIARMPALIATGRSDHAAMTAARSGGNSGDP